MRMWGGECPRGFIPRSRCLAIPAVLALARAPTARGATRSPACARAARGTAAGPAHVRGRASSGQISATHARTGAWNSAALCLRQRRCRTACPGAGSGRRRWCRKGRADLDGAIAWLALASELGRAGEQGNMRGGAGAVRARGPPVDPSCIVDPAPETGTVLFRGRGG